MDTGIALAIAFAGIVITGMNAWIANTRLRLDLLDRRLRVYKAARDYLSKSMTQNIEYRDNAEFYENTRDAKYIFDSSVSDFVENIDKLIWTEDWAERQVAFADGAKRDDAIEKQLEAFKEIQQAKEKIDGVFDPYLTSTFSRRGHFLPAVVVKWTDDFWPK
jgi:hypothetical protein